MSRSIDLSARKALDLGQALVRQHGGGGVEILRRHGGTQHVEAVERCLAGDRRFIPHKLEGGAGDGQPEVLGDLAPPQRRARLQGDLGRAPERVAGARRCRLDLGDILLGCGEQVFALARPLGGQGGIAADDQPFAREIGRAESTSSWNRW